MRTEAEQQQRRDIADSAMKTVFSWVVTQGWKLTAEQSQQVMLELGATLAALDTTEPTETLEGAVIGAAVEITSKILGLAPPPGGLARTMELILLGGTVAQRLLVNGRYPFPGHERIKEIACILSRRAGALAELNTPIEEARDDMRVTAAMVVSAVLGDPPNKPVLN